MFVCYILVEKEKKIYLQDIFSATFFCRYSGSLLVFFFVLASSKHIIFISKKKTVATAFVIAEKVEFYSTRNHAIPQKASVSMCREKAMFYKLKKKK